MNRTLTILAFTAILMLMTSPAAHAQGVRECPPRTSELFITLSGETPISICVANIAIPTLLGLPGGPEIETAFQEADCPFFFSEVDPDPAKWTDPEYAHGSNDNESPPTAQCQIRGGGTSGSIWQDATNFADAVCAWQDFHPETGEFRCSAFLVNVSDVPSVVGGTYNEQVRICTPWSTSIIECDGTFGRIEVADQSEFDATVGICFAQMRSLAQAVTGSAEACADTSNPDTLPLPEGIF